MLSHDNIFWTVNVACERIKMRENVEVMISYLPLSHVAANMVCQISIWFIMNKVWMFYYTFLIWNKWYNEF